MKNRTLIFLLVLSATGISIAQTVPPVADSTKDSAVTEIIINNPYDASKVKDQRHATADLVSAILNINADKLPVAIQYQDNDNETAIFVKEIQMTLAEYGLKVSTTSSPEPMPMANNPRHLNCTYQVTNSSFVITAYPQKPRQ